MADDINIEIVEDAVNIEVEGTATWDSLAGKPTPVAQNSFIVSDAALDWVVKTLVQVQAILGLGTAAYQNVAAFAAAIHLHETTSIYANAFANVPFANPLTIDCTTDKDNICASITGNTVINIAGSQDGDAGMIIVPIDAVGGYTITMGAAFTKQVGATDIDNTANAENIVSWRMVGADVYYTINQVV